MKKKGVSYAEILIAVTIFSVGFIPLFTALTNAFQVTVFNRDYTSALEYTEQLKEEIKNILATKVYVSDYPSLTNNNKDIDSSLEGQIRDILTSRSEEDVKSIYSTLDWQNSDFNFSSENIVDERYYRKIEIGNIIGEDTEGIVRLPIKISVLKNGDSSFDTEDYMVIKLDTKDSSGVDFSQVIEERNDRNITLESGTRNFKFSLGTPLQEDSDKLRVVITAKDYKFDLIQDVRVRVRGNNPWQILSYNSDMSSFNKMVFEIDSEFFEDVNYIVRVTKKRKNDTLEDFDVDSYFFDTDLNLGG